MTTTYCLNCSNHSVRLGLPPSLDQQIVAAAAAGYDSIALDVPSILAHAEAGVAPGALADLLAEHGIAGMLGGVRLTADPSASDAAMAELRPLLAVFAPEQVRTGLWGPIDTGLVASARRAVDELDDLGIGVGFEPVPTIEINSVAEGRRLIDAVGRPSLRMIVDTWHFFRGPSTWEQLDALPLEQLLCVEVNDAPPLASDDLRDEFMNRRVLPGEGVLDLTGFREHVKAKGFDGMVSVEVLSAEWRSRPIAEFAQATLTASRRYWEPA